MRIQKQQDIKAIETRFQGCVVPVFELKINTNVHISQRAVTNTLQVNSPVQMETVFQAAAMIRNLMLAKPCESIETQANANRDQVAILLEDE